MSENNTTEQDSDSTPITALVPKKHAELMQRIGDSNERTLSAQLRVIIREWADTQPVKAKRR